MPFFPELSDRKIIPFPVARLNQVGFDEKLGGKGGRRKKGCVRISVESLHRRTGSG
jgi:hypothetical protein